MEGPKFYAIHPDDERPQKAIQMVPSVVLNVSRVSDAVQAHEQIEAKLERKGGMRLTNAMRSSVMSKIYDFKFKKSGDKLDEKELKLSHRAMVATFGNAALEAVAKIGYPYAVTACDDYGQPTKDPERIALWKGRTVTWRVGGEGRQYNLRVKDPLPPHMDFRHDHETKKRFAVKPGALADEIMAWYEDCQAWLKEKKEVEAKVNAVLNSVTTFAALQKTWPDGERFWKDLPTEFPFRNQVPALRIEELNKAIGI